MKIKRSASHLGWHAEKRHDIHLGYETKNRKKRKRGGAASSQQIHNLKRTESEVSKQRTIWSHENAVYEERIGNQSNILIQQTLMGWQS